MPFVVEPICYLRFNQDYLVLDGCKASVLIADVHASVQLSQTFRNPFNYAATSATYTFGLVASAAVCGFEMIRQDGTIVEGIIEEKEKAKKEYDQAIEQGYTASLGAEETKDIFSISVGNIDPNETVTINIHYMQTLTDDEKKDQIRFYFPRTYVQRYGTAPSYNAGATRTAHQPFQMDIVIQQANTIKALSCPSGHSMSFELGKPDGFAVDVSVSDSQMAKVSIRDNSGFLTQDIVLIVTATNLDHPRCFIEPHPSPDHNTMAMGLTLVPRFQLPDVEGGMEYVFLVDRSGSMAGKSIELVREALVVLLRGLPAKGTRFNIVSFGSRSTKLWGSSQVYSQESLEVATKHIDTMEADYGGTEIAKALDMVFSSLAKPLNHSVSVFLLTDGGAWDVSSCVQRTETARKLPSKKNFLRVFTVGIGDGASTETCDSIARAGEGISVYVGPNEPLIGKCARLVRAARNPPLRDLQVGWLGGSDDQDDFELVDDDDATLAEPPSEKATTKPSQPISLFSGDGSTSNEDVGPPDESKIVLPPPPKVQQGPVKIANLFPGTRSQVYAIISGRQTPVPSSVTVRGIVSTTGDAVELSIPVVKLISPTNSPATPLLHSLAAKAMITDREDKAHNFPSSTTKLFKDNAFLEAAYLKKDIIRLGTMYNLTSKHTSFVAVDRRRQASLPIVETIPISVSAPRFKTARKDRGDPSLAIWSKKKVSQRTLNGSAYPVKSLTQAGSSSSRGIRGGFLAAAGNFFGGARRSSGTAPPAPASAPVARSFKSPSFGTTPRFANSASLPDPASVLQPQMTGYTPPGGVPLPPPNGPLPRPSAIMAPPLEPEWTRPVESSGMPRARTRKAIQPSSLLSSVTGRSSQVYVCHGDKEGSAMEDAEMERLTLRSFSAAESAAEPPEPVLFGSANDLSPGGGSGGDLPSLARLQQFDGGFKLTSGLLSLLGIRATVADVSSKCSGISMPLDVAATILALAWIMENCGEDESLDIREKANDWLVGSLGSQEAVDKSRVAILATVRG